MNTMQNFISNDVTVYQFLQSQTIKSFKTCVGILIAQRVKDR